MKSKIIYLTLIGFFIVLFSCQSNYSNTYLPDNKLGLDTYVEKLNPKKNYAFSNQISIGNFRYKDSLENEKNALLKIRCSSIPKGAKIDSAFLYLSLYKLINTEEEFTLNIERIVENWDVNKVTWYNQPKTDSIDKIIVNVKENNRYYKINVTNFITGLASYKYPNYGLLFKTNSLKTHNSNIDFFSSNTLDLDSRPKLTIYFNQTIFN